MAEILRPLDSAELDFIRRAMVAAAHGGFFPDWEFSTLFGIERAELLQVIEQWPDPEICGDHLRAAVLGSLNLLYGYPHGLEKELLAHLPEGREAIPEMMKRGEIFIQNRALQKQLDEMVRLEAESSFHAIGPESIKAWVGKLNCHDLYNKISLMIAEGYTSGSLKYEICDGIMNELFFILVNNLQNNENFPEPFLEIFNAFDAGEHYRKTDKSDDPIKDHTDPWIAEIMARPSHPMT
jgi:hypothetical protein